MMSKGRIGLVTTPTVAITARLDDKRHSDVTNTVGSTAAELSLEKGGGICKSSMVIAELEKRTEDFQFHGYDTTN